MAAKAAIDGSTWWPRLTTARHLASKGHQINAALSTTRQTSLKRLIGTHLTPA